MDQSETFNLGEPIRTGVEKEGSILVYPVDKYRIEVKLDPEGKFLGITGISFNKDFLSSKRKEYLPPLFNLDEAYPEEPSE